MELKFIEGDLPDKMRGKWVVARAALRANPGVWAEIARYPRAKRYRAGNDGQALKSRFTDLEYTTRTVGDEVVAYARAVTP